MLCNRRGNTTKRCVFSIQPLRTVKGKSHYSHPPRNVFRTCILPHWFCRRRLSNVIVLDPDGDPDPAYPSFSSPMSPDITLQDDDDDVQVDDSISQTSTTSTSNSRHVLASQRKKTKRHTNNDDFVSLFIVPVAEVYHNPLFKQSPPAPL
jgi:hypothetical protein